MHISHTAAAGFTGLRLYEFIPHRMGINMNHDGEIVHNR